jgi:hypothetical protein
VKDVPFITFAAVAQPVAARGWRPFPGMMKTKVPAMPGWSGLNVAEWDDVDLVATIAEYQPADLYCCCLAVQAEIVVIDADIVDPEHALYANELADNILGATPLMRIGFAPKCVRIYCAGERIKSRKLHPLEIFSGSGQFVGFGWHAKAGRPYIWPHESPLTIDINDNAIPLVTRAQLDRFTSELFKVVPRRLLPTKQSRSGSGAPQTINERLRMLTRLRGSWNRAAAIVLGEAVAGCRNETAWAVVASAAGHGVAEDILWDLFAKHFTGWDEVSEVHIASMIERTRPVHRPALMTFITKGGGNDR